MLAIGIGGGIDILQATAERNYADGSTVDFTGVELNATTAGLMQNEYKEATNDRYHLPGVRVLLMSGYADDMQQPAGSLDGDFELLDKPFRKRELARRVRRSLDREGAESPALMAM